MTAKDFTPAQAKAWVKREAALYDDNNMRLGRILGEERFLENLDAFGMTGRYPISEQAHRDLIRVLKDALK
jgi:hypothetical protein